MPSPLPPDVVKSWRDLLRSLEKATDIIELFAGLTEQLATNAENKADVRDTATMGLLFASGARQLIEQTRQMVGEG